MVKQSAQFNMDRTLMLRMMKSPKTVLEQLKSNPAEVLQSLQAFLAVMQPLQPAESFKSDSEGFAQDLVFKKIRAVVLALIESSDCSAELRELCIRFLL